MQAHSSATVFENEWEPLRRLSIPFHYDSLTAEVGKRPVGFHFSDHIVNIVASFKGHKIVACGESHSREIAEAKAVSELIERSALILHGAETSNGWAAHPIYDVAKTNAILELVERDAVLAHWYSSTSFCEIESSSLPEEIQRWSKNELARSEFPHLRILLSTQGLGPSVTCLLVNDKGYGVVAHGSRESLSASITSAIAEACRAAHSTLRREYWNDSLKLKSRQPDFVDPGTHAVYYAYHEAFPTWIFGPKLIWSEAQDSWSTRMQDLFSRLDEFTFTTVLRSPLYVGFAEHPKAFALHWRTTSTEEIARTEAWIRLNLKPEAINANPHIVS